MKALKLVLAFPLLVVAASHAGWRSEGPPLGTIYDVAIDPSNPSTAYALSWNGGLWRSEDGGATWALPSTELVGRTMLWLEIDRANPSTLWAGEKDPGESALWRSKDKGATWKLVQDKVSGSPLNIHPVGFRIAFAASRPADIWVPSTNLHYRSRDGGKTWSDFRVPDQDAYAMAVDPKNADIVYAAGHGGDKFHFSRSDDNGKSWKAMGAGLGAAIKELVVDSEGTLYADSNGSEIWRSTDRGANWSATASPVSGTDDIYRLQVDPTNPKILFAATEAGLYKSTDGGASWRGSDQGVGRYLTRSVAFAPGDSKRMLAAVSGTGVFKSADGGATWSAANGGLSASWIEGLEGSPRNGTLYVRASIGLFRRDASGEWEGVEQPFSDGKEATPGIFFDRQTARGVWAFEGARLWRSTNDGLRWDELKLKDVSMRELMKGQTSKAEFQSFVQDPGNPQTYYAGAWSSNGPGLAVSKSVDAGKNWKPAGKGLPEEEVDRLLAEAPGVIFALCGDQLLFRSDDGAATWKPLAAFPTAKLRELAIDPSQPARLYAATEDGLFRSTDSGATWSKVDSLAKEDVEDIAIAPDGRLFAGHFHGISMSKDGGATWTAVAHDGLQNTDIRALAIFGAPPRLAAGTAGNGVFTIELP